MKQSRQVPLMLSVPKEVRNRLRKLAAEQNLKNPDQVTSASTLAREIVCLHVEGFQDGPDSERHQIADAN